MRSNILNVAATLTIAVFFCAGCASTRTGSIPEPTNPRIVSALSSGDTVKISFTGAPELNETQKIGPDGMISLPLIGEVNAAGKTVGVLQSELASRYKTQLQNSEVVVTLEARAIPVVVSGAVQKPGRVTFERPSTLLEAIMEAGGFTPEADVKKVALIRIVNGEHETRIFNLKPVLSGTPTQAIYVSGGDVIYVPERLLNF
ncbi:MAG: polysaccharide export protein [Verrucomicrobia bacterium]|nr:polysaccharide export protein [Verrucomicrobiota bacterium]MBV9674360.1 polysaccharide export protein [Verrucomicrobiota bacterium]